jgi:hypothetical protein
MKKSSIRISALAAILCAGLAQSPAWATCGNGDKDGPSPPPCTPTCEKNCPASGSNIFDPYTGNVFREITDLQVWGGVGEHQLAFKRYAGSRYASASNWFFGNAHGLWRHSYQWEMADAGTNGSGQARVNIYYPRGEARLFTQISPTQWNPAAGIGDVILQNGNIFTLQTAQGWQYHFAKLTNS